MLNTVLAPGPDLDSMVAVQLQQTSQALNSTAVDGPVTLSLYPWVRHTLTLANAYAIYGPENIFARHPELERHFWDFEDGMLGIVLDLWPSITARKAYYARLKVLDGLHRYVLEKRYKNASVLIQRRIRTNLSYGLSKRMVGHGELILLFGILGNAVPTTFWVVANIFSRPALVKQLREELEDALELKYTAYDQKETVKAISANTVRTCPRLYSACRESLRTIANLTSARYVLSDTFLANKYFLRKGSVVQIASGSLHKDADIWGSDAETFNAERFLTDPLSHSQKREAAPVPKGVPSAAFRAFGGGNVLCPGRHFAQTEIMCFTALLLLSFEITDADGAPLKLPAKDDTRIPLSVMKPVGDPQIKIHRRDCSKNSRWVLTL
ncbi:MAG: hypothetical protein M1820_010752 [Bogoriella megaspora]|nr:MAG: hypothetical protein M1820_010752 [Bogoriella megaspora]